MVVDDANDVLLRWDFDGITAVNPSWQGQKPDDHIIEKYSAEQRVFIFLFAG